MKHLCGFVWKIFEENNFATILLYCGKKVSSSLFMKLRSIDILLASAESEQAPLCIQLGRMFLLTSYILPLTYNYAVRIGRAKKKSAHSLCLQALCSLFAKRYVALLHEVLLSAILSIYHSSQALGPLPFPSVTTSLESATTSSLVVSVEIWD